MNPLNSVQYYWGHKLLGQQDRKRRGELHLMRRSTTKAGQVVQWSDGRTFRLTRALDDQHAGGYYSGVNSTWWEAVPLDADREPHPYMPHANYPLACKYCGKSRENWRHARTGGTHDETEAEDEGRDPHSRERAAGTAARRLQRPGQRRAPADAGRSSVRNTAQYIYRRSKRWQYVHYAKARC